ncbi:MAG: NADH:flavin oxidoreductase [Pirellulaceae bacterium]|nr:NADH:flavin oxidoreductase [Pirellulaceae bacterium]
MSSNYPRVAQLRTVDDFQARLAELGIQLPCDPQLLSAADGSPLAAPLQLGTLRAGNRWCIHPMEGWDANRDGTPSDLTIRRWQRFGQSGAKLIWGGEAAAVRPDGRANPNQTLATTSNEAGLKTLLETLKQAHRESGQELDDLVVGLQLTHSGRFCKPEDHKRFQPRIAYHHPLLDAKFKIDPQDDAVVFSDAEIDQLIEDYVTAAHLAHRVGFDFVDVKACHGYLLHEFLSARSRSGHYGGDLVGRTRALLTIIGRIRQELPSLQVGVRLSLFDFLPFQPGEDGGRPVDWPGEQGYPFVFGSRLDDPTQLDLEEPKWLFEQLSKLGVIAVNLTCGSPYYNPHIQRPALFPPSDGYQPPEDPLVGVARQIHAVAAAKKQFPSMPLVGSGYTYLQEFLPLVAQATLRAGWVDSVGLGRMVLSYPEMPIDTLAGKAPVRKLVCRTFSDCTTAPRNGIVSGCYPLDPFYKAKPERQILEAAKGG